MGNLPEPVNSPHKEPVTRKMVPFDDVIMVKLSVNYVSEKTTQQLHARVETVYAINVIREGTSPEHVSYRTRGLAASPL